MTKIQTSPPLIIKLLREKKEEKKANMLSICTNGGRDNNFKFLTIYSYVVYCMAK